MEAEYNGTKLVFFCVALIFIAMIMLIVMIIKESRSKRNIMQEAAEKLEKAAYVDSLTGFPNLNKFRIEVEQVLQNAKPGEYMLATVDIDNFKYINDIFGFEKGNEVLKIMAEEMQKDITGNVIMARVDADNFAFLFTRKEAEWLVSNERNNQKIVNKIKEALGSEYQIKFSLGVYYIQDIHKDILLMIDYANIAKKSRKGYYENSVAEYTSNMDLKLKDLQEITIAMERALTEGEFVPFIQPKYSLETGEISGAEVLVRWFYPGKGMISPDSFIPLFEKNGFIEKLDQYMFEKTCQMIEEFKQKGIKNIPRISVNVSKNTLLRPKMVERLLEIIGRYHVVPQEIEIELTEGVLGEEPEKILKIMTEFKKEGFFISIDDFGSGYSSLNLLKDITADILKMDKGFLSDTLTNKKGCNIIHSVIDMSKLLNLETVAEGVETVEQADRLREMGCDVAQGFYFSRPIPRQEFEELLVHRKQ